MQKVQKGNLHDTAAWDAAYIKWSMGEGPKPGKHPDPKHLWNTNPSEFKWAIPANFMKELANIFIFNIYFAWFIKKIP